MTIGLSLLAAHLAGDFLLQTDDMAVMKFENKGTLTLHALIHALLSGAVFVAFWGMGTQSAVASAWIGVTHFGIDWDHWKEPKDGFETFPIWFDQSLHVLMLALAVAIGGII